MATIMSLFSGAGSLIKPVTDIVKPLLSGLGGIFLGGGFSPYIGALIILAVVVLAIKIFLTASKLILLVVGVAVLLFLLAMVA